jgi:hypothetical protein
MNIADTGHLVQWAKDHWMRLSGAISGLATLVGLYRFFAERKEKKHEQAINKSALILQNRANILCEQTNYPALLRSEWASFLPDPTLIDEVLRKVGTREVGKVDRWIIDQRSQGKQNQI